MIGSIVAGIVQAIIGSIMSIFSAKQAKENEYNALARAEQMKSIEAGKVVEVAIEKAQVNILKPANKAELMRMLGVGATAVFMMITLSGCLAAKVEMAVNQYKPVIKTKKPAKEMFEGPNELTPREQAMGQYIGQLRAAIGTYNAEALRSNKQFSYPIEELLPDSPAEIVVLKAEEPKPAPAPGPAPPK